MDHQRATWTPSSVRRNCDFCVKKKVKCPGDEDGTGCLFCKKKGVCCIFSLKQKPGPKRRKAEVQDLGPATGATLAPKESYTPQMQQQHPLATGVAESKGDFHAGAGDRYASGVSGESGSPVMVSSPPSTPPLRPSKRFKTTHDEGYRSARQEAEGEWKRKNVPLQPKPTSLTQWLWGSEEDDSRPASVHYGREAPLNPPFFYGISPPSCTSAAHRAPGDDSLGRARHDSSAGTFGAQRAFSGGAHILKTAIEPGGNFDEAGGGCAGSVHAEDCSGNGGSFVSGFKGEEPNMEELLGLLNPLDSLIDEHISGGSDASSNSSVADDDEMARIEAYWTNQKSAAGGLLETAPEIGVDQGVGGRQNESLSGGAPRSGGNASGRGVRNDVSLDVSEVVLTFGESLLPELGYENGEGFRGGAAKESYPAHPPPTAAFPLASEAPVDGANEQGAMSENTGIGFATNSNRASSADQLDGGGGERYSSPLDPFAYDFSQGQLSLGDRSGMGNVMNEYIDFLGGSSGEPPVIDAGIDAGPDYHV